MSVSYLVPIGGPCTAMVAPSTNGTFLPPGPNGVRIYLPPGTAVTYTISNVQPVAPPTLLIALTAANNGPWVDENLTLAANIYVTAVNGSPFYREM